jgi:hypothetical protein
VLFAAAAALLPGRASAVPPGAATLLVPGPDDGALQRWSARVAAAVPRSSAARVERKVLGGPDGVTAANRFATQVEPDGRTLLVLCGGAAQARLVGDPRAHFDAAGWAPVCAEEGMALVAGRAAAPPGGAAVRVAFAGAQSPAAAALCGLSMMGLDAVPVAVAGPLQAEAAFQVGSVDAVLLHGADVPARLAALSARPWFTLDANGQRDAAWPDVPCMSELVFGPTVLRAAARSVAAAARLHAALVLPALTPSDRVASWRAAAARWTDAEARSASAAGMRALSGADAAQLLSAALAPAPEAALAYRDWLLRRFHWRAA